MFLVHRVFVEFHRPRPSRTRPVEMVQPVLDAVYIALKRRQSRRPLQLYVDRRERAQGSHGRRWNDKMIPVEEKLQHIQLPKTGFHQIVVTEVRGSRTRLTLRMAAALSLSLGIQQLQVTLYVHTLTVTPSPSDILTQSHTHTCTTVHTVIIPPSHMPTASQSYPHIVTHPQSHPHIVTPTQSHPHIVTPMHTYNHAPSHHTCTSLPYAHSLTSSHSTSSHSPHPHIQPCTQSSCTVIMYLPPTCSQAYIVYPHTVHTHTYNRAHSHHACPPSHMPTASHSHILTQSHPHSHTPTQPCTQSSCMYLPYAHSLTQSHPHLPTHTDLGCRSLLGPVFGWSNSRYFEVPHGLHQWQSTFEPSDSPFQEDAWAVLSGQIC